MATPVIMPKLEMAQERSTILEWLLEEGATVQKGDPLLVVETDKATVEIEAPATGILTGIRAAVDQEVPVTEIIAYILDPGEDLPESPPPALAAGATRSQRIGDTDPSSATEVKASPVARRLAQASGVDLSAIAGTGPGGQISRADVEAALKAGGTERGDARGKVRATPAARRLARERGLDLSAVPGTGPRGRVQGSDVQGFETTPGIQDQPLPAAIPMKGVRRLTADRLAASSRETAPVTLVTEVDATELVAVREKLKGRVADDWGFVPGYNDLLGIIVARALREFPYMNARLSEDGTTIEHLPAINLGLAVETERGLLVPVVKEADHKGLRAFGEAFRALVGRARSGQAKTEDLSGSTFTITNLGMYEIDAFTPIINLPQAAILGVGRIQPRPVARGDQVVVRRMWTLSLTFDHRLVDGAPAARFLQRIKGLVETPFLLFE